MSLQLLKNDTDHPQPDRPQRQPKTRTPTRDLQGFAAARVIFAHPVAPIPKDGVARLRPGWVDFYDATASRREYCSSYPAERVLAVEWLDEPPAAA